MFGIGKHIREESRRDHLSQAANITTSKSMLIVKNKHPRQFDGFTGAQLVIVPIRSLTNTSLQRPPYLDEKSYECQTGEEHLPRS